MGIMSSISTMPKAHVGLALAVFSAMVYGFCPAPARAVYADGANPSFLVFMSVLCRALLMGGTCYAKNLPLFGPQTNWKRTIGSGFFQALSIFGIMGSLVYLESALTWIIMFTYPLMLLLFQGWRGEAKLTKLTVGLTLLAFVGLTFVLDVWHTNSDLNWVGLGLVSMGAVATASRTYIYGKQMTTMSPFVVGAENFIVALVFLLVLAVLKPPVPPQTFEGALWAAVSITSMTVGAFCVFYGISLMGSFRWSLLSKMELIFVTLFSTVFFDEVLKTSQYAGIAVVLGSLVVYQFQSKPRASDTVAEAAA